jgi:hypothetical protein
MSSRFTGDVNFLEGIDYTELKKFGRFSTLTLSTNEIAGNDTVQFAADPAEDIVSEVDINPEGEEKPDMARIIAIKLNVKSGSTDSSIAMFQSDGYEEINRVVSVSSLDVSSTPESYNLGGGLGTPFTNKEGESEVYFEVDENSGNDSRYDIELNWLNIPR